MKAIGYIRVSDEGGRGDDLMSPAIQLTAIKDHCARNGYELATVLEDIDRTGTLWKRRQIEQAVRMIEAGEATVIVVWKISRVARNRKDWAVAVDRVEGVGGRMESATEQLDSTTSTGRFTRGMLAELAVFESEQIGDTWKSVHRQRAEKGLPHYGPEKLGYDYTRSGYVINDQADLVHDLYRRYTSGEGLGTLTLWLRVEGATGARGEPWSRYGVSYYLRSKFAAGLLYIHDPECKSAAKKCQNRVHRPGAHEPILTPDELRAYERSASVRATRPVRSKVPVSRLSGVVICAGCDHPMQLQGSWAYPRHVYVCRTNRLHLDSCPAPGWVRRDECEDAAREWLGGIASEVDELIGEPRAVTVNRRERLERRIIETDKALGHLAADLARRLVPESAYLTARDELLAELEITRRELSNLEPKSSGAPKAAVGLLSVWDSAAPHETASAVRHLLRVKITRGQPPVVIGAWTV